MSDALAYLGPSIIIALAASAISAITAWEFFWWLFT